jgi:ribose transport system permease protein
MKDKRAIRSNAFSVIGIAILLILFGALTKFSSLAPSNIALIIQQSYVLLICATGVYFVMSMGGLDFSQGSIVGISSIVVILAGQTNLIAGLIAGTLVGACIGLLNGFLHVRFKIGSFIVTICTELIFRGACAYLTTDSPYSAPIYMYMLDIDAIAIPIVAAIVIIGWIVADYTKLGKYVRMIGSGETATRYSGVNIEKTKMLVFAMAGMLAGLAATINVLRVGSITASAGTLTETNVMIALVLGGLPVSGGANTKFSSVVLGVLMLSILNNGLVLLKVEPAMQQLIKGVIFLVIVAITTDRKSMAVIK